MNKSTSATEQSNRPDRQRAPIARAWTTRGPDSVASKPPARRGGSGFGAGRRRDPIITRLDKVDYKDIARLRRCIDGSGKLLLRRLLNHTEKVQRAVSVAVKRARYIGLLPNIAEGRVPRG